MSIRKIVPNRDQPTPVIDVLDLRVNIGEVRPNKTFRYLRRMMFSIIFPANSVLFSKFGADAALTNGIKMIYKGEAVAPIGLKDMFSFSRLAYDMRIDTDETAVTKLNMMTARFSMWKVTRDEMGFYMGAGTDFHFKVQDNLSGSANTSIVVILQGWRI